MLLPLSVPVRGILSRSGGRYDLAGRSRPEQPDKLSEQAPVHVAAVVPHDYQDFPDFGEASNLHLPISCKKKRTPGSR